MADLNALIAQGAQFNMPDQLGQYAKMQQLQAGQQQMRTAALQEQSAGMQLQQLKQDRDNMAKLSQKLSVKGLSPRQFFEALQTSGDSKSQQLGIEGLMKLDATEAFDRSQQTIPGQTPAQVGGELGSGTAFMDNAFPGMPAPVNALASRAAAPAASTNALAPTPAAADPAVSAIEAEMRRIQPFVSSGATGAKEAMARLEKKLEIASKRYTVGDTLMGQSGNVFGTAPAKVAAPVLALTPDVEEQRIRIANASRASRAEAAPRTQQVTLDDGSLGIVNMDTGVITRSMVNGAPAIGKDSAKTAVSEQQAAYNIGRLLTSANQIKNITEKDASSVQPTGAEALASSFGMSGTANYARSANRQIVQGAQRDALDALLYLATGAAYNKEQLLGQMDAYIPAFTDKPEAVAAKKTRLTDLIKSAKTRAGKAWTSEMDEAMKSLTSSNVPSAVSGKVVPAAPAASSGEWKVVK
jgi:hypothetical protein